MPIQKCELFNLKNIFNSVPQPYHFIHYTKFIYPSSSFSSILYTILQIELTVEKNKDKSLGLQNTPIMMYAKKVTRC